MQDINPIQGPIRPQDEQSKKSKTPAGAPDKFKEIYRVQAVDSTDEEKKKKRKRPEEEVEDLPPPTTQPLQTSSSNLEASPYAVQPPSKKAAAIQGPKEEIASGSYYMPASSQPPSEDSTADLSIPALQEPTAPSAITPPTAASEQSQQSSTIPSYSEDDFYEEPQESQPSTAPQQPTSQPQVPQAPQPQTPQESQEPAAMQVTKEPALPISSLPQAKDLAKKGKDTSPKELHAAEIKKSPPPTEAAVSQEEEKTPEPDEQQAQPLAPKPLQTSFPKEQESNGLKKEIQSPQEMPQKTTEESTKEDVLQPTAQPLSTDELSAQIPKELQEETQAPFSPLPQPLRQLGVVASQQEPSSTQDKEKASQVQAPASASSDKDKKDEEKDQQQQQQSLPFTPITNQPFLEAITASPPPVYTTFSPQVLEMFDKMVGTISVLQESSGERKTSILLTADKFSSSPFFGSEIIIEEDTHLAPGQYNIKLIGSPEAVDLFQAKADDLLAAFQQGNYTFKVQRLDTALQTADKPLFKRKETISEDKEKDMQQ